MIHYHLDLPVDKRMAKKNRLPAGVGYLLIEIADQNNVEDCLSEYILYSQMRTRYILGQSIVIFTNPKDTKSILEEQGISHSFDNDICPHIKRPGDIVVECRSKEDISFVIKSIKAEAFVFYGANGIAEEPSIQRKLIEVGRGGYFERNFLALSDIVPLFIFYSSTHPSIEIIGNMDAVKRVFLNYCSKNM